MHVYTYTLMHAYTPTSIYTLRVLPRMVARTLVVVPDCNQRGTTYSIYYCEQWLNSFDHWLLKRLCVSGGRSRPQLTSMGRTLYTACTLLTHTHTHTHTHNQLMPDSFSLYCCADEQKFAKWLSMQVMKERELKHFWEEQCLLIKP